MLKSKRKSKRNVSVNYIWNDRHEQPKQEADNSDLTASIIRHQKELAIKLQQYRLDYIEKHQKEPDFTEFEFNLIDKYS